MNRVVTLVLIIAGALALLLGTVVWDERRASRRCEHLRRRPFPDREHGTVS